MPEGKEALPLSDGVGPGCSTWEVLPQTQALISPLGALSTVINTIPYTPLVPVLSGFFPFFLFLFFSYGT